MWNPNLFQNFDLHYEDLPSVALEAARESIFHRGFPKNAALVLQSQLEQKCGRMLPGGEADDH